MRKLSLLAAGFVVASMSLFSTAFAADKAKTKMTKFTIKVEGKTIMTTLMSELPPDAQVRFSTRTKAVTNEAKKMLTLYSPAEVEVRQDVLTIFKMDVENGVVEIEYKDVAPEATEEAATEDQE